MKILEFHVFLYFELYLDFDFCAKWAVFSEPVTYYTPGNELDEALQYKQHLNHIKIGINNEV